MCQPRKTGGQQLSCNNNFARAISAVIPDTQSEKQGLPFKDWIPLALGEKIWLNYVNAYFDECRTIDEERDDEQEDEEYRPSNAADKSRRDLRTRNASSSTKTNENSSTTTSLGVFRLVVSYVRISKIFTRQLTPTMSNLR